MKQKAKNIYSQKKIQTMIYISFFKKT